MTNETKWEIKYYKKMRNMKQGFRVINMWDMTKHYARHGKHLKRNWGSPCNVLDITTMFFSFSYFLINVLIFFSTLYHVIWFCWLMGNVTQTCNFVVAIMITFQLCYGLVLISCSVFLSFWAVLSVSCVFPKFSIHLNKRAHIFHAT